jgi:excisionase family DNA binding protein
MKESNGGNDIQPSHESLIDSRTAATYLNIHPKTLERMARMGEVPATKHGRSWQFLQSLLSKWLKERMKPNLNEHRPQKDDEQKEKPYQ